MEAFSLLRAKLSILKNRYLRLSRRQAISYLLFFAFSIYLGIGLFRGLVVMMRFYGAELAQNLLVATLSGTMTFVVFWGMGPILNELYLRSDLELLLASPVSRKAIYLSKLVDAIQTVLFPAILGLATLCGYGAYRGSSWSYYVLATLVMFVAVVLAVLLCMFMVILVIRFLPTRRAQELWTLLWALCFGLIWAGWMLFANTSTNRTQVALSLATLAQRRGQFLHWAPAGWAARICLAWLEGDWGALLTNGALLLGTVAALYWVGQVLFEKAFYEGWSRLQASPTRKTRANHTQQRDSPRWLGWMSQQARAIVTKDWLTLFRDLRRLAGLVFPLLMGIVYAYLLATQIPGEGSRFWLGILLSPMVVYFVGLRLATVSLAIEGENMALLHTAPLTAWQLFWAKLWASGLPMLAVAEVTGIATVLVLASSASQGIWVDALYLVWIASGLALVGIGCAGLTPQYRGEAARRTGGLIGGYAYLLLAATFWGVSAVTYVWLWAVLAPPSNLRVSALYEALPGVASWLGSPWLIGSILMADFGMIVTVLLLARAVVRKLDRWQVTDLQH